MSEAVLLKTEDVIVTVAIVFPNHGVAMALDVCDRIRYVDESAGTITTEC